MMSNGRDALIRFFQEGGSVVTRLRERGDGDVHDAIFGIELPGLSIGPEELVRLLEELEQEGRIVRTESVHPCDSSEYSVEWRIVRAPAEDRQPESLRL